MSENDLGGTIQVTRDQNPVIRLRLEGTFAEFWELSEALKEGRRTRRQKDLLADLALQIEAECDTNSITNGGEDAKRDGDV